MISRFKRIIPKATVPDADALPQAREQIEAELLQPQIRAGLRALEQSQADLNWREQELLASASTLYEQLRVTANELAGVRQQQTLAAERIEKLRSADRVLEQRHAAAQNTDRSQPARVETLPARKHWLSFRSARAR